MNFIEQKKQSFIMAGSLGRNGHYILAVDQAAELVS